MANAMDIDIDPIEELQELYAALVTDYSARHTIATPSITYCGGRGRKAQRFTFCSMLKRRKEARMARTARLSKKISNSRVQKKKKTTKGSGKSKMMEEAKQLVEDQKEYLRRLGTKEAMKMVTEQLTELKMVEAPKYAKRVATKTKKVDIEEIVSQMGFMDLRAKNEMDEVLFKIGDLRVA